MMDRAGALLKSRNYGARQTVSVKRDLAGLAQNQRERDFGKQYLRARMVRTYPDDLAYEGSQFGARAMDEMADLAQRDLDWLIGVQDSGS
jgi:hypothetical protein